MTTQSSPASALRAASPMPRPIPTSWWQSLRTAGTLAGAIVRSLGEDANGLSVQFVGFWRVPLTSMQLPNARPKHAKFLIDLLVAFSCSMERDGSLHYISQEHVLQTGFDLTCVEPNVDVSCIFQCSASQVEVMCLTAFFVLGVSHGLLA
mmetsp:Transcript_19827/g.35275  ORF Transcript_19827/g.35275 Transcript_19827/m.35275 type:complete len:150 (+) Transcript_19827:703-1152(+)